MILLANLTKKVSAKYHKRLIFIQYIAKNCVIKI